MQKAYSRIHWENYPSTETPLNESNLNRIDLALDTVDDRVVTFDTTKANQTDLLTCVDGITFNTSTGILTISFKNGTTATIDTGLAKLAVNFDYDDDPTSPHYQQLILEMKDGTYKYIDLSSMITQFEFDNTSTVVFNVDAQTGHISAVVPDGSITANKLDPNVVVTMQAIEDAAEADALKSEGHAVGKQNGQDVGPDSPYYHNNAKYYCEQAQGGGSGGHVIKDSTTTYTQRNGLKFLGKASVSDDANGDNTIVTIEAGGAVPHLIVLSEAGSAVRAIKGTKTIYATETSAEHFECDLEMDDPQDIYGVWTIHAVLDGDDAMMSLNVDTIKVYVVDDSHMHADITVTYPNGATVSCSMTGAPTQYATSSPYTFVVHSYGVWRITGTRGGVTEIHDVTIYENGQEEEVTLSLIPDGSTVTPTDDIQLWLACAGIEDKPYTMLQQVLADSATLLKVLTNDNASDYLARSTTWATGITADSNAMTIIGSYDYCANVLLSSGSTWNEAIQNSTYFESIDNAKVPAMTSNTTPKGVASASTEYDASHKAFNAFDGNTSTSWVTTLSGQATYPPHWLKYKFPYAVCIKRFDYNTAQNNRTGNYKIQASNDDSTWVDLTETLTATRDGQNHFEVINNANNYLYYRFYIITQTNSGPSHRLVQFYGRSNGGAQSWLKAGGIQKSYTQLSQILGDTATLRDLMASNDAVDYLVTAKAFIDDICSNQTAMSLIGANDYAADTLLGDATWAEAIGGSSYKYSVINRSIPTMTSNTTPSGVCSASSSMSSNYPAWYGFSNNTTDGWIPNGTTGWIKYEFPDAIIPYIFREYNHVAQNRPSKVTVEASNDDTTYVLLSEEITILGSNGFEAIKALSNLSKSSYKYFRINVVATGTSQPWLGGLNIYGRENGGVQSWLRSAGITNKNYTTVAEIANDPDTLIALITNDDAVDYLVTAKALIDDIVANETIMQAIGSYDYCANTLLADSTWATAIIGSTYASSVINISTPQMTSDTTPSGVCSAKTTYSGYPAWKAFDKDNSTLWASAVNPSDDYLRYKFAKAVNIGFVKIKTVYSGSLRLKTLSIKASNDNFSTSETLMATVTLTNQNVEDYLYPVSPSTKFDSYGIENLNTYQSDVEIKELDFLGRENGGVQSWLRAGNITDKTYTTLAEVLADTTTLSALIASHDAVDYLVTAKGLIDGIVADATAMSYIGLNNYCANTLLADAEWKNGICNSTYWNNVLNAHIPTMISYTDPSGETFGNMDYSGKTWNAFDKNTTTNWTSYGNSYAWPNYVGYDFGEGKSLKALVATYQAESSNRLGAFQIQGSNDGTAYTSLYAGTNTDGQSHKLILTNPGEYRYFRIVGTSAPISGAAYMSIYEFDVFGREDV